MAPTLEDLWWREEQAGAGSPPLLRWLLAGGELAYRAAVAARTALHRAGIPPRREAGAPVISVGNLAVGGAGKTPAAIEVARRLVARGRRVAVLARGYGASATGPRLVSDGASIHLDARAAGDEPYLVARRLPGVLVLCGPRRADLARWAVERLGAEALVLDDGFQHLALRRDLDLVVLDAADPVGNGRLLPRGPNREPWGALARAHLGWLSRVDQAAPEALGRLRERVAAATGRPPVESRHAAVDVLDGALAASHGPEALRGRRVLLLCALARPEGFRRTLGGLGAVVVAERAFRDHHHFTPVELEEAAAAARAAGCQAIALTEKDAVKLSPAQAASPLLRVVRIEARVVAGGAVLDDLLERALRREPGPASRPRPEPGSAAAGRGAP